MKRDSSSCGFAYRALFGVADSQEAESERSSLCNLDALWHCVSVVLATAVNTNERLTEARTGELWVSVHARLILSLVNRQ
ncbi:MAG TPA: hypothetical protein V6C50_00990 [Crinalium sp.]